MNPSVGTWAVYRTDLCGGGVVPLPGDAVRVRTAGLAEYSPERGGGQLLRDLPDQTLGVVGEQHQVLLPVNVERSQEAKCVLWVLLLLEDST